MRKFAVVFALSLVLVSVLNFTSDGKLRKVVKEMEAVKVLNALSLDEEGYKELLNCVREAKKEKERMEENLLKRWEKVKEKLMKGEKAEFPDLRNLHERTGRNLRKRIGAVWEESWKRKLSAAGLSEKEVDKWLDVAKKAAKFSFQHRKVAPRVAQRLRKPGAPGALRKDKGNPPSVSVLRGKPRAFHQNVNGGGVALRKIFRSLGEGQRKLFGEMMKSAKVAFSPEIFVLFPDEGEDLLKEFIKVRFSSSSPKRTSLQKFE